MKRTKTTTIVVHHSVTNQLWDSAKTMANIKGSHDGVSPYHRVIGYNWQWSDPAQDDVKFHAGNYPVNLESIAVCMVGNFVVDDLKDYQKKQLTATLKEWGQKYNIKRANIKLHREVRLEPTACPGKIDQDLISILLQEPMPTDNLSDHIVDGMPADQRIAALKSQVGRLVAESQGLTEALIASRKKEEEYYQSWQKEIDARKKVEEQLKICQESGAEAKLAQIKAIIG